jgi:hypothetical protein
VLCPVGDVSTLNSISPAVLWFRGLLRCSGWNVSASVVDSCFSMLQVFVVHAALISRSQASLQGGVTTMCSIPQILLRTTSWGGKGQVGCRHGSDQIYGNYGGPVYRLSFVGWVD